MAVALDDLPTLGRNIREARKAIKMSQRQLARLIGASHTTVGRYEADVLEPKISRLQAIAETLQTTIERLLDRDPDGKEVPYAQC